MNFYDERRFLYPEADASELGLGAGLLQVRKGLSHPIDEVPDNSIL